MAIFGKRITVRGVQKALGILWLIDGLLQLQPQMFTANFASQVIAPAAAGQPGFVTGPMNLGIRLFLLNPALCNTLIAVIQIGLGLLILWKKTAKFGLMASVVWGLFVWYAGEGLGGLASGQTLLLMGAPGAALLYSVLALGVLPCRAKQRAEAQRPASWLIIFWAVLWVGGAVYQLLPGQNTIADISGMVAGNADGAPGWLAALDMHVANVINGFGGQAGSASVMHMTAAQMAQMASQPVSGFWFIALLALLQACIGLAVFVPAVRKWAVAAGIGLSILFWFVGQSLGAYFTGLATDPNAAPLFVLLGVTVLACAQYDRQLARFFKRFGDALV